MKKVLGIALVAAILVAALPTTASAAGVTGTNRGGSTGSQSTGLGGGKGALPPGPISGR